MARLSHNLPLSIARKIRQLIRKNIELSFSKHQNIGEKSYVDPSVQVLGWGNVKIGNHSCIGQDTLININHREKGKLCLDIGNNCYIARRNFFSTGDMIRIGDYCLTGIENHFLGSDHIYSSPFKPYITTGTTHDGVIDVGVNCWLGSRVTILKGVSVGYGSIIGAGTVLNKSIPPLSIAVGNPYRIIKRFDVHSNSWVSAEQYPEEGEKDLPSEQEYLEILRKEYPIIEMPRIANSQLFGDL
ncbi:MAG: acyltransferase [Stigonema ocellatum SAG 48.90 = DSM 106950]|nr:acyltransferase [Stigonema ocellatum SAG 48.90 = DSM 106950]